MCNEDHVTDKLKYRNSSRWPELAILVFASISIVNTRFILKLKVYTQKNGISLNVFTILFVVSPWYSVKPSFGCLRNFLFLYYFKVRFEVFKMT